MKLRPSIGFVIVVAGLMSAGAAPTSPASTSSPETDRLFSTVLQTPRLYAISATGASTALNGAKICLGGDGWKAMFKGMEEAGKDPDFRAELSKGCTTSVQRTPGSFSMEQVCDEAKGAIFTSRFKLSGSMDDIREHMEVVLPGLGTQGAGKTSARDVRMTYLGNCPVDIKPGQTIKADGKMLDIPGMMGAAASR